MEAVMTGAATNAQITAFLTALRMKGETVEELIGFAQVMRQKVVTVPVRAAGVVAQTGTDREMLIDTCGTGGDASGTFNISTATAFVVAGAGLRVAKHGNRSVSSLCGSADVVETLGINLELSPAQVGRCVDEVGIGFPYAPLLHTAMTRWLRGAGWRPHGVPMLGPDQPAGANAGHRVYSDALCRASGTGAGRARHDSRVRRAWRRRAGRDLHHRREPLVRGPRRRRAQLAGSTRGLRHAAG